MRIFNVIFIGKIPLFLVEMLELMREYSGNVGAIDNIFLRRKLFGNKAGRTTQKSRLAAKQNRFSETLNIYTSWE